MKVTVIVCLISIFFKESSSTFSYQDILTKAPTQEKLTPSCLAEVNKTTTLTPWYWLMVDASSKIPAGLARGNVVPMGNYDACLAINQVQTKFCKGVAKIDLPQQKKISRQLVNLARNSEAYVDIGLYFCVLKSCTSQDLGIIFNNLVEFEDGQCWSSDSTSTLDPAAIIAIFIFTIIGLITLMSTIYDVYLIYTEKTSVHPLATAFSLYTNLKKLFHLRNSQQLQCLNGIKSISMLWVVLGHVYMAYVFVPLNNYVEVFEWLKSTRSQYISGATVSVDTFLLIGGFLTVYSFQSTMDKGVKFNVPLYYFHRYIRLTPALAAMLLAHAALFNYFGSGPVWQKTDVFLSKACRQYWWSTLLYIQNYANPTGTCIPQSWYLSVDMQLFLVSPLILILMRQWPKWCYIALSLLSFLSILTSFLTGWFLNLNGQMTGNTDGTIEDYMSYYYMPTHTRMPPYLFGIMLGYAVHYWKTSDKQINLGIPLVITGWILSLSLMAICIYAGNNLQFKEYDRLANAWFIALMRPTWSIAVGWAIFACTMNYGGPIDVFLSLPIFQILSKLCYSIYLVHYSFIFMENFTTKQPLHFTEFNAFHKFLGDFLFSLVIGVMWTLVFESPIIVLEKILLGHNSESKKNSSAV